MTTIETKNGYVKSNQLIGWALSVIGTVVALFVWGAGAVIANDRLREQGDNEIRREIVALMKENSSAHICIIRDLSYIKSRIGILNDFMSEMSSGDIN